MDCGVKRKLDCVTDMDVLVHHGLPPYEDDTVDEHVKKMRLSVQLSAAAVPSIVATASSSSPPPSASSFLDGFSTVDSIVDDGWSSLASAPGGGGAGPGPSDYWTCPSSRLPQHGRPRQGTSVAGTAGTVDSEEEMWEDIPSTTEVINSLRKVILWMSAQGDQNNDYIQYLSEVEKYAKSKQLNAAQQRKITQYLIRR